MSHTTASQSRRVIAAVAACLAAAATFVAAGEPADAVDAHASPTGQYHSHGPDGLELDPPAAEGWAIGDVPTWSPSDYDGLVATADIKPDLTSTREVADITGMPMVHLVYVHPAKTTSRFGEYAAMFQVKARQSAQMLADLYGRSIRLDERANRVAGGRPVVDITVFKSKYSARQLEGNNQFNLVRGEIDNYFKDSSKKYIVWLDADSSACGQGTLYRDTVRSATNLSDTYRTLGIVYRPYAEKMNDHLTGGWCAGRTFLHELSHNMGAVQSVAPNLDSSGAHCADNNNDVMCYVQVGGHATPEPTFDHNHDDYWDPGATKAGNPTSSSKVGGGTATPWWTVNLSKFLCPVETSGLSVGPNCDLPNASPGY